MREEALQAAMAANYELFMESSDRLDDLLAELGLTSATAQLLWLLTPGTDSPSLKELSERLHCNASNVTYIADQLVDRLLIERRVDPSDRRFKTLALTPAGHAVRNNLVPRALALNPLHVATTEELRQLTQLIGSILDRASEARRSV